jgi:uncharacterized protein (DUF433 family)
MNNRIISNPKICHGKPCIKDTRIMVSIILELLEASYSFEKILETYPQLTKEDIQSCIDYALTLVQNEDIYFFDESEVLRKEFVSAK